MMEDIIKRSDAIEHLKRWFHGKGWVLSDEDVKSILWDIPSVDRPQEFIPCSERLPSEKERAESYIRSKRASEFIVMIKGANRPTTLYLSLDNYWFDESRNFYEVIAWMSLPNPCKGVDDE